MRYYAVCWKDERRIVTTETGAMLFHRLKDAVRARNTFFSLRSQVEIRQASISYAMFPVKDNGRVILGDGEEWLTL